MAGRKKSTTTTSESTPEPSNLDNLPYKPRTKVWAKMRSFPAWPAFIVPPDSIPKNVLESKPDKYPYCAIFIPDGNYCWCKAEAVKTWDSKQIEKQIATFPSNFKISLNDFKKIIQKKERDSKIKEAMSIANGDLTYDEFIEFLQERNSNWGEEEEEEDEEGEEEVEEVKEQPPKKKIRKLKNEQDKKPDVEEEAEYGDNEDEGNSQKRQSNGIKQSLNNGKKSKESTEKSQPKRVIKRKNESDESATAVAAAAAAISNQTKVLVNEDEKQHQLWLCRVKLQKTLIQRKEGTSPTIEELSFARLILFRLNEIELTTELLRNTKLHKVLKKITKDPSLELKDSFNFHDKSNELLDKWKPFIDQIKADSSSGIQK